MSSDSAPYTRREGLKTASSPPASMEIRKASLDHEEIEASNAGLLDFGDDTITLLVGSDNTKFTIHAKQLKKSPFFENAMKEPWLVNCTISLPADDPGTLHFYLHFLYAAQVPETTFDGLAILYVYGEKAVDSRFKHAVIGTMIKTIRHMGVTGECYPPFFKAVDCIYTGTLDASPARKLLVDIFSSYGSPAWFGDREYDPGFLRDLVLRRMHEDHGEEAMYGHMIVAERYLEEHGPDLPDTTATIPDSWDGSIFNCG